MSISAVKRAGHRQVAHRDRLRDRLRAEECLSLRYHGSPYGTTSALFPVLDHLRRAAGFTQEDAREVKLAKLQALLVLAPIQARQFHRSCERRRRACDGNGLRHAWRGCLDVRPFFDKSTSTVSYFGFRPQDAPRRSRGLTSTGGPTRPPLTTADAVPKAGCGGGSRDRQGVEGHAHGSPSPPPLAEVIHTPDHPAACVSCKAGTPSSSRHTVHARLRQGAPNSLAATRAWRSMRRVPVAPQRDAALQVPRLQGARLRRLCLEDDCCHGKAEHQHCWAPR